MDNAGGFNPFGGGGSQGHMVRRAFCIFGLVQPPKHLLWGPCVGFAHAALIKPLFVPVQKPEDIFKMFFGGNMPNMEFYEDPVSSGRVGHDLQASLRSASAASGKCFSAQLHALQALWLDSKS